MMRSCYYCGYFRKLEKTDGSIRYYCEDKDCTIDPTDPECNYE